MKPINEDDRPLWEILEERRRKLNWKGPDYIIASHLCIVRYGANSLWDGWVEVFNEDLRRYQRKS